MKHEVLIGGLGATPTDLLYLISATALAVAVVRGQAQLRWNDVYAVILSYFAVMLVSALAAADPGRSALKLATQAYLLSLPLLACTLVDTADDLRTVFRAWLGATAVTALVGVASVGLFWVGGKPPLLEYGLHDYGTLAPGNYPRVESTFGYPAMLCNYLTVSLMILLICRHRGWIGKGQFNLLLFAIGVTAAFSLTPGLGGFILAIGLWLYISERRTAPALAGAGLAVGVGAAALFLVAAALTPIMHPAASFLVEIPGYPHPVAPSIRFMAWVDAAARVIEHPLLGAGIGADATAVDFVDPSGGRAILTDAHNAFLNFASQCGLPGLAAMGLLVIAVWRMVGPLRLDSDNVVRLGLGLAWLNAFVYQGLTGSYEDARHLWVLLGLLLAVTDSTAGSTARPQALGRAVLDCREPASSQPCRRSEGREGTWPE